jgi:hypothetical protein
MGYQCIEADHAVFTHSKAGIFSIIALYVDNITIVCKDLSVIKKDKALLRQHYEMTDLGES